MKISTYNVIGVMSGTSLDGIDLCYVRFRINESWKFDILNAETIPYTKEWLAILGKIIEFSSEELDRIDIQYSKYLGDQINDYIRNHNIQQIDAVCSHGHTVFHQPERHLTYQIGNLSSLSNVLNQTVVCDFRIQDVEFGGQGAPLVPIGDKMLFDKYDFCLNLGGFANISFDVDGERVAYDICPVNIVLNYFSRQIGQKYDDQGKIAASGIVDPPLLNALNNLAYYNMAFPKSLGLEWVQSVVFPLIKSYDLSIADVLRTFVEHAAVQITDQINFNKTGNVLVTGGGTYHSFLVKRLIDLSYPELIIPSGEIINYKEALIFGFLGVLKLRNETNCLKSVTGAKRDHSSGKIFQP
jgi:anhydro-N-acetylmuramic acid kinase